MILSITALVNPIYTPGGPEIEESLYDRRSNKNNCDDSSSTFSSANESEIIKQVDNTFEERLDPEGTGDSASMLPYCFESTLKEDMYPNKQELSSSNSVIKQNLLFKECEQQIGEITFLPGPSLKPNGKRKRLNYVCDGCGKYIRTKKKLIKHMRKFCTMPNSEKKPFKCEECGKYLLRRKSFKEHMFTHRGYKPFKCVECDKCFSRMSCLASHSRVHGHTKPYKCDVCGRCFGLKSHLNRHTLIHTGERPHKCDECGHMFRLKDHLTSHLLIHNGEKPHSCEECGRCFRVRASLTLHMLVHSGVKQHKCDKCGRFFSRKCYLVKHVQIHR
uniref:C2H2-type domain-containing protein n=1 Tax=Timema douglasi TaxID=61478 RepID=A0A7R8VSA1_TIMDO|nr:unnamed protein product [Timema douglasi]